MVTELGLKLEGPAAAPAGGPGMAAVWPFSSDESSDS